jgi:hypothetical protein
MIDIDALKARNLARWNAMAVARAIVIVAAVFLALVNPAALASQATLVTPAASLPMTGLASFLYAAHLSLGSYNNGTSRRITGRAAQPLPTSAGSI